MKVIVYSMPKHETLRYKLLRISDLLQTMSNVWPLTEIRTCVQDALKIIDKVSE